MSRSHRYQRVKATALSVCLSYRPPPTAACTGASFLKWEGPTCIGRHMSLLAWYIVTSFRKLFSSSVLYKVRTSKNTMCGWDVCPTEFVSEGVHRRADVVFCTSLCSPTADSLAMLPPAQLAALHISERSASLAAGS